MDVANMENLRVRLSAELKAEWDGVIADRKISQQEAAASLIAWFVKQDPLLQAMLLGQVPAGDGDELAKIVLRRLAPTPKPTKGKP